MCHMFCPNLNMDSLIPRLSCGGRRRTESLVQIVYAHDDTSIVFRIHEQLGFWSKFCVDIVTHYWYY